MTLPNRPRRHLRALVVMAFATAMAVMGCGTDEQRVGPDTTAVTTTVMPSTTVKRSTATDQLQPFIDLAAIADRDLAEAAQRINAAATEETITYDQRTVELLNGISIGALADALPAGMPDELERAGLLVYSDLVSRLASMSIWCVSTEGTRPRIEYTDNGCFVLGAPAAARFEGDLAALVSTADRTPAFEVAAPESRPAEALAARIEDIVLRNAGCASVGGFVATEPISVTWDPSPGMGDLPDWEGRVDGIQFYGTYDAATGWRIWINAC